MGCNVDMADMLDLPEEGRIVTKIALPQSFYNVASIVLRLGSNRRTNKRAIRHAMRPPTKGYWVGRCLCAWCRK